MTTTAAEQAAMRRALELAATPGVPLGPNPRVGCVLLDDDGRDGRRGLPPRRRHARTPRPTRWPGPGTGPRRHRRRDPRALQPHRPHRPVRAGAASTPAYAGSCSPRPTRTRSRPGERRRSARPASRSTAGCWRDEARDAEPGLDVRGRARPPVRHLEVRDHPRRPQRRGRRHQPLGLRRRPPGATPTGCARCAT